MALIGMRLWGTAAVVCLLLLLTGCAGGESTALPAQDAPGVTLLNRGDLQSQVVKSEDLPEPCSPVAVLESHGAEVAATPLYDLGSKHVAEAVGVTPTVKDAVAALDALEDEGRLACIQSTIERFGPNEGSSISVKLPVSIAQGDEGSVARFMERDGQKLVGSTVLVSLRSGRCVATLLFILPGGSSEAAYVQNLTRRADRVLTDDDCR